MTVSVSIAYNLKLRFYSLSSTFPYIPVIFTTFPLTCPQASQSAYFQNRFSSAFYGEENAKIGFSGRQHYTEEFAAT